LVLRIFCSLIILPQICALQLDIILVELQLSDRGEKGTRIARSHAATGAFNSEDSSSWITRRLSAPDPKFPGPLWTNNALGFGNAFFKYGFSSNGAIVPQIDISQGDTFLRENCLRHPVAIG